MQVIDKQDRKKLGEGRTNNMGFAFLQKIKAEEYKTVQPISPCKDYLNDVVYGEKLNVKIKACGLDYTPCGFMDTPTNYIAIKMLPSNRGTGYRLGSTLEKDTELLKANYKNIENLLNWVEDKLKINHTTITKANDDIFVVEFDSFWSSQTYLISLYSLLLRMGQFYDGSNTPEQFLNSYNNPLDVSLWNIAKPKLEKMFAGHSPIQVFDKKTGSSMHSYGICACNNFTP